MSGECPKCGEHPMDCIGVCAELVIACPHLNKMTQWISISDKLPDLDIGVLFISGGQVYFGEYTWYDPGYQWYDYITWMNHADVTFWMPIPEPPGE